MIIDTCYPILVVEDSMEDFEVIKEALEEAGLANPIFHCKEGEEALDFLFHQGEFKDEKKVPRPILILLDLNLPGTSGREILKDIKEDDGLRKIPVIVLTTSDDERDIEKCYNYGANSYVQKPVDVEGFFKAVKRLKEFWCEIVIFPMMK